MVSDQLQAFHKNNIIYEKQSTDNDFDLITAKSDHLSELPTFLREGVETDKLYFKEVIVWVLCSLRRSRPLRNRISSETARTTTPFSRSKTKTPRLWRDTFIWEASPFKNTATSSFFCTSRRSWESSYSSLSSATICTIVRTLSCWISVPSWNEGRPRI